MSKYHLLIDKFINSTISPDEREVLERWVRQSESNQTFFKNRLKDSGRRLSVDFDADLAYQRFTESLKSKKKSPRLYHRIFKYAAVLAVMLAIGFIAKQQLASDDSKTSIKVVETEEKTPIGDDIVIKLADGSTKILNSEGHEVVTDAKGNVVANKGENSLTFEESNTIDKNTPAYNEVYIPYGQTFKLKLSDGTLVWLNAGSKLRFPQSFAITDTDRIVYLEGEAFFDVAKNKDRPFIVNAQEVDVRVLGTRFNISSYDTDNYIATTLVEGSVNVYETRTPDNVVQLTPSFQVKYDKFGNNFSKTKVDTNLYTAWMHNRLVIDNLKFSEILVRLERRFFVKFVNNAESLNDEIYKGEFEDENIEAILKTISLSTPFNYEINQNVITITE